VAFTGHMIDAAGRETPRFPAALESAVAARLRACVATWHAPVVFSSAASGSDLLMIEAALDTGAEVNIVLPFARDEFVRTSVAPAGAAWVPRFDRALASAARVMVASDEDYLGDDVLFAHAAVLVEGLARLRAGQLETTPRLMAVLDPTSPGLTGGTAEAVRHWRTFSDAVDVVDLAVLRGEGGATSGVASRAGLSPRDVAVPRASARELCSMLFADVAGYSRLRDAQLPRFQTLFWELAAGELDRLAAPARLANTWGDAIFAVFDTAGEAAGFALRLRERFAETDWAAAGIAAPLAIRIGLHAGVVFAGFDPVLGRHNYFGAGVTRAARIEPVTPPGLIYASEAFAATLAAREPTRRLEYVGAQALAKHYGELRLYRLEGPLATRGAPAAGME